MKPLFLIRRSFFAGVLSTAIAFTFPMKAAAQERIEEVRERIQSRLKTDLSEAGFRLGNPAFIRIFKESRELELWLKPKRGSEFKLYKTWSIAAMSGKLGPKLAEGDLQAPEGFYEVTKENLNPNSRFHLSFNIGYPNAFDQALGRTGSFIMVHGSDVSIGCFAMTDLIVEDIYVITEAALAKGQKNVPVQVFPFPLTEKRLSEFANSKWVTFWKNLQEGFQHFEEFRQPPTFRVKNGWYVFDEANVK